MIKVFLLHFVRQMDFFQVMILIRDYLKKLDWQALKIETQATEFETRLQAFDNALKESRKSGKTKKLHELDDLRDEMVIGLYKQMHAISDIYACGGRPLYALAVLTVPTDRLDQAAQILEAADQSLREHGCELVGGHTTRGPELSFGLAVIGSVVPARTLRKSGVQVDDVFVLSKRLGVGHYVSAGRVRPLDEADRLELLSVTCQSNAVGKAVADAGLAHACTDVTGEGFLGAIASMARSADVAVEVFIDQVPMMTKAMEYAADGLWSTLSLSNFANVADILETDLDENTLAVLTDPQTSGGLLIACAPSEVDGVLRLARQHGNLDACVVGRAVAKGTRIEARSTKESQQ